MPVHTTIQALSWTITSSLVWNPMDNMVQQNPDILNVAFAVFRRVELDYILFVAAFRFQHINFDRVHIVIGFQTICNGTSLHFGETAQNKFKQFFIPVRVSEEFHS